MANYELHVRSSDLFGHNLIENIVEMAALGAVMKKGVLPRVHFPHMVVMTINTDEELFTTPVMRVFDADNGMKEVIEGVADPVAAVFSTDLGDSPKLSKEELEALQWEDFKVECKRYSIGGRDRSQMTKKYLA